MPDVVYILGGGSTWRNNELRFSLRSLADNFPHQRVFIVGKRPFWLANITHIPEEDPFQYKLQNGVHKIVAAARDDRISKQFVLMNDDFFILKRLHELCAFHKGPLEHTLSKHPTKQGYYYRAGLTTLELLRNEGIEAPLDYSMHYPVLFDKDKVLSLVEQFPNDRPYLFRTMYGNTFQVPATYRPDVKLRNTADLEKFASLDVLSTTDGVVHKTSFQRWLTNRFPTQSPYEG